VNDRSHDEREWANPRNWVGGFYSSGKDSRLIVPYRIPWLGWTLNFGNPRTLPIMGLVLFLAFGLVVLILSLIVHPAK